MNKPEPKSDSLYPRIDSIGLVVHEEPVAHVKRLELKDALVRAGIDLPRFYDLFGVQTCYIEGPYPWDVESVLERLKSGRLTGTQAVWD
jgi:hypothetical protein